jgi:hypothetical protein
MKKQLLLLLCFPIICFGQNPNYAEDVAPIVYGKCLQCHHSGGISNLNLDTYVNTVTNAGIIQQLISTGEMPPWPPDTLFQHYAFENTLSMNEISTIIDWIANGTPLGDTALLPPFPTFSNTSTLGTPDLELQIPTYTSNATASADDYVCFSIPTGLLQNRKIKAIEVIPGNVQIVHHVLVSIDIAPNTSVVTTQNCMGPQGKMIYVYAPGSLPLIYPTDANNTFGVELTANSSISLGMHYPEGSLGQIDSTKVRFYFYPDSTNIRDITTDFLIQNFSFFLPANQVTEVDDSFGPISQDISMMSVFPHMHLLGKDLECYAVTPTNDTINLVKINNWDFEWQGFYFFEKFIKIPAGSMIYAKGHYDNTASASNPNPTPVFPGINTEDEMFIFIFQFLDYQLGDENIFIDNTSVPTAIQDELLIHFNTNRKLLKLVDILGREITPKPNHPFFIIYDDGTVEKRIILE